MNEFIHENGLGEYFYENGNEMIITEMKVNNVAYPLGDITDYDQYIDL